MKKESRESKESKKPSFKYSKKNWILIFSGLGLGLISLIIMALGDITVSVILFVLAFFVFIPIGLLLRP